MKGRVVHVNDGVPGAVYIGRAMPSRGLRASPIANPYRIGKEGDRGTVIALYRGWLWMHLRREFAATIAGAVIACRGKPLACWCRHDGEPKAPANACHGDVIIDLLERHSDDELRAMGRAE